MKPILEKEKLTLFNLIITHLNNVIKRCNLYQFGHPAVNASINNLKASLDKWFKDEAVLSLKFASNNVGIEGHSIKDRLGSYKELGGYFYNKGAISLSFRDGIAVDELVVMIKFMQTDIGAIREKGGLQKCFPELEHISIKEIDYSFFINNAGGDVTEEEAKAWENFLNAADQASYGKISDNNFEFVVDFLKNGRDTAETLNRMYNKAQTEHNTVKVNELAQKIYKSISGVSKYFNKNIPAYVNEVKVDLMKIFMQLDQGLVDKILNEVMDDKSGFDLFGELTKGMSDNDIGEFIESFILGKGTFTEHHLRLIDRIMPEREKALNVASLVTEKLLGKGLLSADGLSTLQDSIKELFKVCPNSNFMTEVYKKTVDQFIEKKVVSPLDEARVNMLKKECMESIKDTTLKKERVRLVLNLLADEENPAEFTKYAHMIKQFYRDIINVNNIDVIYDVFEFFSSRVNSSQVQNAESAKAIKEILMFVSEKEYFEKILSFIPHVPDDELHFFEDIMEKSAVNYAGLLTDLFLDEQDQMARYRMSSVLARIKTGIVESFSEKLANINPENVKAVIKIISAQSSERGHEIVKSLIYNANPAIKNEALDIYIPSGQKETAVLNNMLCEEKDKTTLEKIMVCILKSGEDDNVSGLFVKMSKTHMWREHYLKLVELCGVYKVKSSAVTLKNIFSKRPFFNTRWHDILRVTALMSLRRLGDKDTESLIVRGLKDRSRYVREKCQVISRLDAAKEQKCGSDMKNGI